MSAHWVLEAKVCLRCESWAYPVPHYPADPIPARIARQLGDPVKVRALLAEGELCDGPYADEVTR